METAIIIGQALIKYGPEVARQLVALFGQKEVTLTDWEKVFSLAEKSYDDYVKPNA
jgi:hypothetical protein